MHKTEKLVFAAAIALALLTVRAAFAAPPPSAEKEKEKVLRRLDEAAKNFHSTSADFQFDSVETDPIYDKDIQKGTVYYERKGTAFQMAAHISEHNGKPASKVYAYAGGVFKLFEGGAVNQVTTYSKVSKFESYLMLGFGASGKDLEQKWEIKYIGSETLDGVKTEKLELIAKDPAVLKNIPKVTIWVDPERGVSLKQVFDEGPGQYRVCVYFNFKFPQTLPADAFTFKTDSKTVLVKR
jgi:outer membrane lipoprotein-sorting protein